MKVKWWMWALLGLGGVVWYYSRKSDGPGTFTPPLPAFASTTDGRPLIMSDKATFLKRAGIT